MQCLARLISIDSLNRLYSTKFSPIVALRSVGLSFVNEFSPLKVNIDIYLIKYNSKTSFYSAILCKTSSAWFLNVFF